MIVVARLMWANARDEADPLLHHDGQYRRVAGAPAPPANPAGSRLSVIRTSPSSSKETPER